jgi:hypothetical protein
MSETYKINASIEASRDCPLSDFTSFSKLGVCVACEGAMASLCCLMIVTRNGGKCRKPV